MVNLRFVYPGNDDKNTGKAPPIRKQTSKDDGKSSITVNPGELLATAYLEKKQGYYPRITAIISYSRKMEPRIV